MTSALLAKNIMGRKRGCLNSAQALNVNKREVSKIPISQDEWTRLEPRARRLALPEAGQAEEARTHQLPP